MSDIIGAAFLIGGASLILLAAVGVLRFRDTYARMHAAAKAPTLGIMLLSIGAAIMIGTSAATIAVILVIVLQLIAGPVGTHVLGRSVYRRIKPPLDGPDELADAERS